MDGSSAADGFAARVGVSSEVPFVSARSPRDWSYGKAFARNIGLVSPAEQEVLHTSRVAIVGMGGVGGVHLVTLARLGIGRFTIADPDAFEPVNFNRQYGATLRGLGRSKAEVMAEEAGASAATSARLRGGAKQGVVRFAVRCSC